MSEIDYETCIGQLQLHYSSGGPLPSFLFDLILSALEHGKELEENQSFDVLAHLRNGGLCSVGSVMFCLSSGLYLRIKHVSDKIWMFPNETEKSEFLDALIKGAVKPYEPPIEDLLEDGEWYWVQESDIKPFPAMWFNDGFYSESGAPYVDDFEPLMKDGKPVKIEKPKEEGQ